MTTDTPELVRPRMRRDVAFLETLDGVYVRGHDDAFLIRGAGAYRYLSALLPHLNGSTPLADLVAGLPPAHADAVRSLLGTLAGRGVVVDGPDPLAGHDAGTVARFGGQLALLDHLGDDGTGFARVAAARIVVTGDDPAGLADALTANGAGSAGGSVRVVGDVADTDLDGADALCLVALGRPHHRLFALAAACRARGVAFLPLLRVGERLVLGPWQDAGGADLHSAALRMSDNGVDSAAALWQAAIAGPAGAPAWPPLPGTAVPMAVGLAGFEVFKALSGTVPSDLDDAVVIVDPHRLTVTRERLVPHPGSPLAVPAAPAAADDGDDADQPADERAYRRFEPVVADTVGLARRFDDDAAVQIPVKVAGLVAPAVDPEPVVAFGAQSTLQARLIALETTAARYALHLHRRTGHLPDPAPGAEAVPAERLAGWLGAPVPAPRSVAAADLDGGAALAIERSAVLAGPWDRTAAVFEPALTGLAAAPDAGEARWRALLDAAGALCLTSVARGGLTLHPVPATLAAADPDADRRGHVAMLLGELAAAGARADLYVAEAGAVPVAVVHVRGGAGRVVARAGASWGDAVRDALLEVLGERQVSGTPLERPAVPHGVEADLAATAPGAAVTDADRLHREVGTEDVLAALASTGHRAAAVDLTPPDLAGVTTVARVLLFTARTPEETP
ncbi:hypothetical protein [Jiangella endophytica]|uniref:hypothetical protein n=1 Tax=Jiangella endophytica TaxID=1623398 RepID=UPI0013005A91|nr:hypothetical protein [Jiangella endophytica]